MKKTRGENRNKKYPLVSPVSKKRAQKNKTNGEHALFLLSSQITAREEVHHHHVQEDDPFPRRVRGARGFRARGDHGLHL